MTQRHRKPENWIAALARNGHGIVEEIDIAPRERGIEALLMGLRLSEGIDLRRIAALAEKRPEDLVDQSAVERLGEQGLLILEGSRLRSSPEGMLLLDAILREIVLN